MRTRQQTSFAFLAVLAFAAFACRSEPASEERAAVTAPAAAPEHVHHDVSVRLDPDAHRIEGSDTITLPVALRSLPFRFRLHAGLAVESADASWSVRPLHDGTVTDDEETALAVRVKTWEARPTSGATQWPSDGTLSLRLAGTIDHPIVTGGEEYARSFDSTPGTISSEGVVLSGSTWWLPVIGEELMTFRLTADVPEAWEVVSQGRRTRHDVVAAGPALPTPGRRVVTWDCPHPMEEAYLIAAQFTTYERATENALAQAFLRTPDQNLASKYLEATAQYLEMYRKLIGPYPFEKFALVENFWETGYGMPSFTLLGPQVIRLPFILHSSYPHEILHNWWGNSVYVDWSKGNWCEGLTAYLADHLIREGQGRGTEYRNDALKGYQSYVGESRDFPLSEFRSRHSAATQAVGYGKCLMLWHMLRMRLGDAAFVDGLQRFYRRHRFKVAAWSDVEALFSEVAHEDLAPFFEQWVRRTGALALSLDVAAGSDGALLLTFEQTQGGEPYRGVVVPVAITYAGSADAETVQLRLDGAKSVLALPAGERAIVRIDVDPEFDLFRRLDASETPPTLGEMFGAEQLTLIVPAKGAPLAAEWNRFAESWAAGGKAVEIVEEDQIESLPEGRTVWVLGSSNRFGPAILASLTALGATVDQSQARFGVEFVPRAAHSFAYVARHPQNEKLTAGWVGSDVAEALPGLARKLPHYGKYSFLAFHGEAPDNVVKGTWPADTAPLVRFVGAGATSKPPRGKLAARTALAKLAPVVDPARMSATVNFLADEAQEGRGVGTAGLDRSSDFIAKAFLDAGLQPGGTSGSWFDPWTEEGGPDGKPVTLRNVIGVLPGHDPAFAGQCVVLCAHYDHLGLGWPDVREGQAGKLHPGADDNASGVAVLLEVARILGTELKPARTLLFAALSGEEWGLKGSRHFVKNSTAQRPFAAVNLDSVGRLGEKKLLVLGAGTATEWRHIAMGVGFTTGVESTCVADDPGGSDQVAFHEIGVPAVQLFTGPHADYHRPTDVASKVDIEGLVKVGTWLRETAVYLSERPEPMTSTLPAVGAAPEKPIAAPPRSDARRVSLGTMPEFEFAGPGVKVASVIDGSPAQLAGIAAGDVIVAIDGVAISDLRAYSDLLKSHQPGDTLKVSVRRGDEIKELEARLVAR